MENTIIYIIAPLISGVLGWFVSAYRSKQRKEADQIEIAIQYKELLRETIEDKRALYVEIDKLREELQIVKEEIVAVKDERSSMKAAIKRAAKCKKAAECPVINLPV